MSKSAFKLSLTISNLFSFPIEALLSITQTKSIGSLKSSNYFNYSSEKNSVLSYVFKETITGMTYFSFENFK